MDTELAVALVGGIVTVIAALIGAWQTLKTRTSEKEITAENTLEATLRERIVLRDEQLQDARNDIEELESDLETERRKNAQLQARLALALVENERLKES